MEDPSLERLADLSDSSVGSSLEYQVLLAVKERYGVDLTVDWESRVVPLSEEFPLPQRSHHRVKALADLLTLNAIIAGDAPYRTVENIEHVITPDSAEHLEYQVIQREGGLLKKLMRRIQNRKGWSWSGVVEQLGSSDSVVERQGEPIHYHGKRFKVSPGTYAPRMPPRAMGVRGLPSESREVYDRIRLRFPRIKREINDALAKIDPGLGVRAIAYGNGEYHISIGSEKGLYWAAQTRAEIGEQFQGWLAENGGDLPNSIDGCALVLEPIYPVCRGLNNDAKIQVQTLMTRALRGRLRNSGIRPQITTRYRGDVSVALELPDAMLNKMADMSHSEIISRLKDEFNLPRHVPGDAFSHVSIYYSIPDFEARSQTI